MPEKTEGVKYEAVDPNEVIGELFSGKLSMQEAIRRLRVRLLDLTSRNRLLNYRHPKKRCVQFVDLSDINSTYEKLLENRSFPIEWVPEPEPLSYAGKKPEAKQHAATLAINTSLEAPPPDNGKNHRVFGLQALFYPAEMERLLKKISTEAKSAIEETGSNILYLIFGFLEFYESDDSDKPWLAPIISVPVSLERTDIDLKTRVYRYALSYNGEDVAENQTLREKLRQDYSLNLPELEDEDTPDTYFAKIQDAISSRKGWRIARQLTLGMLSFGKLAIWADLDHNRWPGLVDHPVLKEIFEGGSKAVDSFFAEDYEIDKIKQADIPLIFTADSSQHSAIIDILAGKNMVVNGPPGTGKSQTITNVIASALSQGKKVLFVSEKLAALEVVQRRLKMAGLDHFCLELHSNRTQKRKLIEDLQDRLRRAFPPVQLDAKFAALVNHKQRLARYAELLGSCVCNELGLTVNQILWAAERRRQELASADAALSLLKTITDVERWTHGDLDSRRSRAADAGNLFLGLQCFGSSHPWWGFTPNLLLPGEDQAIGEVLLRATVEANTLISCTDAYKVLAQEDQVDISHFQATAKSLTRIPDHPANLASVLLPRFFAPDDRGGSNAKRTIDRVIHNVETAKAMLQSAYSVLVPTHGITPTAGEKVFAAVNAACLPSVYEHEPALLKAMADALEQAIANFEAASAAASYRCDGLTKWFLQELREHLGRVAELRITGIPVDELDSAVSSIIVKHGEIRAALHKVQELTEGRGIPFDGSPEAARKLRLSGLPDLRNAKSIGDAELAEADKFSRFPLAARSLSDLKEIDRKLRVLGHTLKESCAIVKSTADHMGVDFDGTESSVGHIAGLVEIAACAPHELLPHRRDSYGRTSTGDLLRRVEEGIGREAASRNQLGAVVYLDLLPPIGELKSHVRTLRQENGFFKLLNRDWRNARKMFRGISIHRKRCGASECADILSMAVSWSEHRGEFVASTVFKDCFGNLFCGFETDVEKLKSLHAWYQKSREVLLSRSGLAAKVNLTSFEDYKLGELSAKKDHLSAATASILAAHMDVLDITGTDIPSLEEARAHDYLAYVERLFELAQHLSDAVHFFSRYVDASVSPERALDLMKAAGEITRLSPELEELSSTDALLQAGGRGLAFARFPVSGTWHDHLPRVEDSCHAIQRLVKHLEPFSRETSPVSALRLVEAKLSLDELLGKCATGWHSATDFLYRETAGTDISTIVRYPNLSWSSYRDEAGAVFTAVRSLEMFFSGKLVEGNSINDARKALSDETNANEILSHLAVDIDVKHLLGEHYLGLDTDRDTLVDTLQWGKDVFNSGLSSTLVARILRTDAADQLRTVRQTVEGSIAAYTSVRSILSELDRYGSLDWGQWQTPVRSHEGKDEPEEIKQRLEIAFDGLNELPQWSRYLAARSHCVQEGLEEFVQLMESGRVPPDQLGTVVEFAVFKSIAQRVYKKFPELSRFDGNSHEKVRQEYRALDAEIISLMGRSLAHQINAAKDIPPGETGPRAKDYTEMQLLKREVAKQRRHIPIRQLLRRAGKTIQEYKPCFMMGPLSVAQYLEPNSLKFDLILMDEASQLKPEDAIGAVGRGAQLVVVGDPKQLPPTNFFERILESGDEEDEEEAPMVTGMESILDICQHLFTPVRSLRWHYRSQHDSLIAFSNHYFYKNLVLFPSPVRKPADLGVKYHYIKNGVYKDRQNIPEAQRVVDAACEHMLKNCEPNRESLGVVTLNQTQRDLIEELLDRKLRAFSEGQRFLLNREKEGWPFFVKNLENVQGDERDVIMISTTFGKAPGTERVRQNYGPISRPDGWRRLNVLFTRARRRIHLFTSMLAEDIVLDEKTPDGTKALRNYLEYAKKGVLGDSGMTEREPDSDFEIAVANLLREKGYRVTPEFGVAGFYIDMVVHNPDRPGDLMAAIECDGATYHTGLSVRDRDRIRQEILEALGWKDRIWRIWSSDWFFNPRKEMQRLLEFLEQRRAAGRAEAATEPEPEHNGEQAASGAEIQLDEDVKEALRDTSAADVFVEVGDRVTYCFKDKPATKYDLRIIEGKSDVDRKMINEKTSMAQALLGLSPGEENEVEYADHSTRTIRLLKIDKI